MRLSLPWLHRRARAGRSREGGKSFRGRRRALAWIGGAAAALILLAIGLSYLIDEPLRQRMERNINNRLKGYTVHIGRLDFHPIGLSLDLEDSIIIQDAHPDPPVAHIPNLSASVQWRALLSGRVVADFQIDDPVIHVNLNQTKKEIEDKTPIKERGWREALQEIYPLKINEFVVNNADFTYRDRGPFKPLHLSNLNFQAENIRNIRSPENIHPSNVRLEGTVFEKGKLLADGKADFLAKPHIAFKVGLELQEVELDYFRPIIERYDFTVDKGTLSGVGEMEYTGKRKVIQVPKLQIDGVELMYISRAKDASPTEQVVKKAARGAKKVGNKPTLTVRVDELEIRRSKLGYVNKGKEPPYQIFVSDAAIRVKNFSNQHGDGTATGTLAGRFMDSGAAAMKVAFRPNTEGPDLDLEVAIEDADMTAMNDLFRAYANFDVVRGKFSFYSELDVKNGAVDGYVKPLFRSVDIYDARQDRKKHPLRQLYEGVVGGLSWLLENVPREEVATKTTVTGNLSDPETSTAQAIAGLVQNAFFKSILPGLEREVASSGRTRDRAKG